MKWNKFTIKTTTQATDLISGVLVENGIDGVEIKDNIPLSEEDKRKMFIDFLPELPEDEGIAYLSFYMEELSEEEEQEKMSAILQGIEELKDFVEVGECSIVKGETQDTDWMNNWKQYFKSFEVDNIIIKPTWEEMKPEYNGKTVIQIDPGIAFGTGLHETTQLCIRQLQKHIKPHAKILDVGCGSGILSVIALKLGAGQAIGLDVDENAITAAYENLKVNHIPQEKFRVLTGNILEDISISEEIGYECYDIIVANILADVLKPLTSIIPDHLKKGGIYITSGIIDSKEQEMVEAISARPELEIIEITRKNDWVSITAVGK
ncbi:MAG: 50S ribosomal protein L11 methyltransferase [Lachnospiraceae bacterium]|jgi:ribosomal protein L11 methyltransferase|nr:50S ribosomal protein L11 methyltransferase [Lachnospiraceae bacterium]MCI9369073.1 50S ribosomal protein L11 methyltransferase [Lachnospiraceae bacterium]